MLKGQIGDKGREPTSLWIGLYVNSTSEFLLTLTAQPLQILSGLNITRGNCIVVGNEAEISSAPKLPHIIEV